VGDADYRMRTLLGSCVSITLWHRGSRMGAMSHFLLADRGTSAPGELDGRYGDESMTLMMQGLAQAGVRGQECQAKLFGGGNMFPELMLAGGINVGRRNGEVARQIVQSLGIRVVSESLFGVGHRNIVFDVRTGDVWVRRPKRPGRGPE
jgi:chemotaxis protein CheD